MKAQCVYNGGRGEGDPSEGVVDLKGGCIVVECVVADAEKVSLGGEG